MDTLPNDAEARLRLAQSIIDHRLAAAADLAGEARVDVMRGALRDAQSALAGVPLDVIAADRLARMFLAPGTGVSG